MRSQTEVWEREEEYIRPLRKQQKFLYIRAAGAFLWIDTAMFVVFIKSPIADISFLKIIEILK